VVAENVAVRHDAVDLVAARPVHLGGEIGVDPSRAAGTYTFRWTATYEVRSR